MGRAFTWGVMTLWAGLMLCVSIERAWAQPDKAALDRADKLFKEARVLMKKNEFSSACPKLEESHRLDPAVGTLFNLADCYEHIGQVASAWAGFRDVAVVAAGSGQSERAQLARERAAALEPALSKIRIEVQSAAAVSGLEVRRDNVVVDRLAWGTEVPLDPGKYVVSATAPAKAPWSTTVTLKGPGEVISIKVPVLEAAAQNGGGTAPHGGSPETGSHGAPVGPSSGQGVPDGSSMGIIIGGLAVTGVAIGVGVASAVVASSKKSERDAKLPVERCVPEQGYEACHQEYDKARDAYALFANVALWSFIGAGVSGLGTTLYAVLSPRAKPEPSVRVTGSAGPYGGAISLRYSW